MSIKFTKDHYWMRPIPAHDDATAVIVGVTSRALAGLGDLISVSLPKVGTSFAGGAAVATVESAKAASDLYLPVSGEIMEVNASLVTSPELANQDPLSAGWLFKVRMTEPHQLDALLDEQAYALLLRDT